MSNDKRHDIMSGIEADFIRDKCRATGVWGEMGKFHPEFHDYIERLPHSANSHEPLCAPQELIELYQDARKWAREHMLLEIRCWKCALKMMSTPDHGGNGL